MTLIQFIKSQINQQNEFAELVHDIWIDGQFPVDQSEPDIIEYLSMRTRINGMYGTFEFFLHVYCSLREEQMDQLDLDAQFSVLQAENWPYYKAFFPVNRVILTGSLDDIYNVYCIDTVRKKALYFDLKSFMVLNDILIVDIGRVFVGDNSRLVNVNEAIRLLQECPYETLIKPNAKNLSELIDYLKLNCTLGLRR
ncbi:hypothetical protein [Spirosoma sp.]|uniref:hypothetical protein n=1 Tax=Spirosoma sp. TaxID=1899569 RepID=UPI003B3A6B6A